jgi:hypothetical protein
MNEMREFFEAKQKEKMRIPVAPEMPEFLGERRRIRIVGNQNVHAAAEQKDQRDNARARREQANGMRKIFGESRDENAADCEVAKRHPLKRSASHP